MNIAMPLTAKDFKIEKCSCPVCGRPASVYSRDGHNYLRCMWEDCRLNANMVPVSAERFFAFVEKMERIEKTANKEVKK